MTLGQALKPSVPRRWLLIIAGVFWSFAGGMLMWRGITGLLHEASRLASEIILSLCSGIAFYFILFSGISRKHVRRIMGLKSEKPCLFSFFNIKSYILMIFMITSGILLRKFDILNHQVLYAVYLCMSVPLLLSSAKFYYYWFTNKQI
ncbi:MAG TPA: hypothetical protein PKI01_01820 [Bacteroidales bacterium]|nr:hypothetical protein [Bacteroidales bacterium]